MLYICKKSIKIISNYKYEKANFNVGIETIFLYTLFTFKISAVLQPLAIFSSAVGLQYFVISVLLHLQNYSI